jgi:hypothetical protein
MEKPLLSFKNFIREQEEAEDSVKSERPETDREARSRIAAGLVQGLFGGIGGLTGSIDKDITQTKEVKDSLPYKGCGINEPFKIEKTPIPLEAFKIILNYLNDKKIGDYRKSIKELEEGRAVIVGVRNKIAVKKETANQDRFIDQLYFIPGGAKSGEATASTEKPKNESEVFSFVEFSKIYEAEAEDLLSKIKNPKKASEKDTDKKQEVAKPIPTGDKFLPYQITTVPSLAFYGKDPINPKGTGIKLPGDTIYYLKESSLGSSTYKMMVEGESSNVGRYPIGVTKFETYKPAEVYKENCGMQIHRSSTKGVGVCVGPWSAGCQVFSDYSEWEEFISKAEKEAMNANKFIYALIQLDDIPDEIMKNAMLGIVTYKEIEKDSENEEEVGIEKDDQKKDNTKSIEKLAQFIEEEKEKTNSDEEAVIKKYNKVIKSDADWKKLESIYGANIWDDLDSFLSSGELKSLKFRNTKET